MNIISRRTVFSGGLGAAALALAACGNRTTPTEAGTFAPPPALTPKAGQIDARQHGGASARASRRRTSAPSGLTSCLALACRPNSADLIRWQTSHSIESRRQVSSNDMNALA